MGERSEGRNVYHGKRALHLTGVKGKNSLGAMRKVLISSTVIVRVLSAV
jgi:hypothetical protein